VFNICCATESLIFIKIININNQIDLIFFINFNLTYDLLGEVIFKSIIS